VTSGDWGVAVVQGFDSRAFSPAMLEKDKPAKCWQEIASEMADEPDADTLLQFAREMDEALLQEAREKERGQD